MISTLHYYLNDMYMELGPTLVVEASHKSGRVPDDETGYNGNECKALVCKAGDAILFRSDLWHGALPNCSNERRYMLQVHYGCAYIERVFVSPWRKSPFPENFVDACDDRHYLRDVNALSNFVTDAPDVVGFYPFSRLVDHLAAEADRASAGNVAG